MLVPMQMYLHYYRMIDENLPPFVVQSNLNSSAFQSNITKYGFTKGFENDQFTIYYQFYFKLPWVERTKHSVIYLVLTNTRDLTMTDNQLEEAIASIQQRQKPAKYVIENELTLLFYQTNHWASSFQEKAHTIINYSAHRQTLVNIPVIQIKPNEIYMLRPKKLFPNKYYYVLTKLVYYLTDASEML